MKKRIFSLLLLLCSIITGTATAQESGDKERFFPANSIRCTNVITVNFVEMDQTVPKETIYYEMWTGNDTIVDGKPCVTLWQQFDRDITTITNHPHKAFTPELEGVIYEADNGYVYFKYMNDDGNDWKFLYDFSSPNRNEGDTICLGMNDMEETIYECIDQISTCTLHNGREVQVAEGLMYGIGYQSYPFFFPNYMWVMINAYVPIYDPINFYRNGELLWGVPYDMHSKLAANEQDLDVDGKKWHIRTQVPYIDDRYTNDVFMWIEGDTIVEDIRYKKLYKQTRNVKDSSMGTIEVGYCRQEGDKYYQDGKLMFDFGLGEGDMFATSTENEEAGFFYTVVSIGDTLLLDGLPRKYMVIAPSYEGMIKSNHTDIWVEGIGSLSMGIFENDFYYMAGLKKELQCCSYNGIYIYKKKEESKTYLVTEGKEWQFRYFVAQYIRDVTYKLSGDTIIDGHTYKKEWVMGWNGSSQMELTQGFLREENGKVYRKEYNKEEYLWFDYNANIGDTIFYENSFVKVVGHSDTTIICNGVSRTYKGVDVQVGGYDVNISTPDSSTNYEHFLFPGYIATFYEELGLFTTGDIVRSPSFNMEGCVGYLLYVKQGDTILYQREEENPKEQSKFFADDTKWYGEEDYEYYSSHRITPISYSLGTDTVIDGELGQTLYREGVYQGTFITKGESVWFKPSKELIWWYNNEEEEIPPFLLYDFSLQVGDTIYYSYQRLLGYTHEKTEEYDHCLVVKATHKVYGHKVIDFNDGERWIEGIGSVYEPFLERWRPRLVGPGNTYENIYQVVADSATIWFKGELANPNIEPWIKTGMTWTENKQNNEGDEFVKRQIKVGAESLPGRFRISGSSPFSELQVINNKVYGSGMDNFILCYDFSLAKGDKVSLLNYYWYGIDNSTYKYDHCYVTNVDTVVYYGVPRKRVTLSGDREDVWVEGIGSLTRVFPVDNVDGIQSHTAFFSELIECSYNGELLYRKNAPEMTRPTTKRGYGLYHSDSYLYRYTINEAEAVTDSTDFARWYDKTVIYFDVDTIGPNAFSGATFRQGQILYFTERLNTIFKDAFTDINIIKRTSQESLMSDDLTLVFAGANPPGIDKNHIMDYADSTYHINYVVPDLAAYIEDDIQWTYTTLMTIDDFVQGYVSPENEVTVNDSTETDVSLQPGTNQGGNIDLVVHARPRKEIPVRIGEGENKDIYSRAPAWMRYTMELRITDTEGTELYTGEMQCSAYGECQFNASFASPANNIIHIYSRSIDMFGRATEWAVTTFNLDTSIDPIVAPNTDAPYYDLQGRPVAHPTRGIYIKNGRKVVL